MKRRVKQILLAITAMVVVIIIVFYMNQPILVEVVQVQPGTVTDSVTEPGFIESVSDYRLYPEVGGSVQAILVQKNQVIQAGDLVLSIDPKDYLFQKEQHLSMRSGYEAQLANIGTEDRKQRDEYKASIARLRADLVSVEGQRKSAQSALRERDTTALVDEQLTLLKLSREQAETTYQFNLEEYEKLSVLFEHDIVPEQEFVSAGEGLKSIRNDIAKLDAQIETAQAQRARAVASASLASGGDREYYDGLVGSIHAQIASFEKALEDDLTKNTEKYYQTLLDAETAQIRWLDTQIDQCTVVSPVGGIVYELAAEGISAVSPEFCVARIQVPKEQTVVSTVSTKDVVNLSIGQPVEILHKLRSGDIQYRGVICEIEPRAVVRTSSLGLEERRVAVTVKPDGVLPLEEGYDVDVRFEVLSVDNCLFVPLTAVFVQDSNDCVFTIVDGRVKLVTVQIGEKSGIDRIITEGLQRGDVVVRDPNIEGLADGGKVKVAAVKAKPQEER